MADRLLSTYLNDHFVTALGRIELARRIAGSNRDNPVGDRLALAAELVEDRAVLQQAMDRLGVGADHVKLSLAWSAEKLGRLKLNGRLVGYSPLSRVEELELLTLGVEGRLLLWQGLERVPAAQRAGLPFEELIRRARSRLRVLRRMRLEAVEAAFG